MYINKRHDGPEQLFLKGNSHYLPHDGKKHAIEAVTHLTMLFYLGNQLQELSVDHDITCSYRGVVMGGIPRLMVVETLNFINHLKIIESFSTGTAVLPTAEFDQKHPDLKLIRNSLEHREDRIRGIGISPKKPVVFEPMLDIDGNDAGIALFFTDDADGTLEAHRGNDGKVGGVKTAHLATDAFACWNQVCELFPVRNPPAADPNPIPRYVKRPCPQNFL